MRNYTKVHTDSEVFGKISPAIFQAILDTIPALGFVLNWEPLACVFLADVLRQISLAGNPLVISHVVFAKVLWGNDVTEVAAERRLGRCVQSLTRCQAQSGCLAVWIERGGRKEENGEVKYFRTTYRHREFFDIFADIQALAVEQDLMALPHKERRQTQLAIVQSVCDARQYQRIPARARQQRHFQNEKPELQPSPKVEALATPSMMVYSKAEEWYLEQLQRHLISLGTVGPGFNAVVEGVRKRMREVERAAMDVIHGRAPVNGKGAKR